MTGVLLLHSTHGRPELLVRHVGVGVCLGLVDAAVDVIRWGVDRVDLQRLTAVIDEVMSRAGCDHHRIARLNARFLPIEDHLPGAGQKEKHLLYVAVRLRSDFSAGWDVHHDQLPTRPREQYVSKVLIRLGLLDDVGLIGHEAEPTVFRLGERGLAPESKP